MGRSLPAVGLRRSLVVVVGAALVLASCGGTEDPSDLTADSQQEPATTSGTGVPERAIVVFTKAAGFRHDSIGPAADVLRSRLTAAGAAVEVTDDAGVFRADRLVGVDVVVFVSTTGDVLDDTQQAALQQWVEGGGGWVGVHAVLDAEYEWPFYEELAGAWFLQHPAVQAATVTIEDGDHPATVPLPGTWRRTDEWYDLRSNPRAGVHVLATVSESTYDGGVMGADHPIAWCDSVGQGQTFVTAMGHTTLSWSEPAFVDHVLGGIASVAEPGSCR